MCCSRTQIQNIIPAAPRSENRLLAELKCRGRGRTQKVILNADSYNLAYDRPSDCTSHDPGPGADTALQATDTPLSDAVPFYAALPAALLAVRGMRVGRGGFAAGVSTAMVS